MTHSKFLILLCGALAFACVACHRDEAESHHGESSESSGGEVDHPVERVTTVQTRETVHSSDEDSESHHPSQKSQ